MISAYRRSLGLRLASIFGAVIALAVIGLSLGSSMAQRERMEQRFAAEAALITDMVAQAAAPGLRFNRATSVQAAYAGPRERSSLTAIAFRTDTGPSAGAIVDAWRREDSPVADPAAGLAAEPGELPGIVVVAQAVRGADGQSIGRVVSYWDRRALDEAEARDLAWSLGAAVLLTFSVLLGVFLLMRRVLRPLRDAAAAVGALSEGRTDAALPIARGQDEVARMIQALVGLRDRLAAADIARAEAAAAQDAAASARRDALARMAAELEQWVGQIATSVARSADSVEAAAGTVAAAARETDQRSSRVAASSDAATGEVTAVTGGVERIATSIAQVTRQATDAASIARDAMGATGETDAVMTRLAERTQRIDAVVGLIGEVADRTNLLALNATIEAARAGDAGKGFAVVAAEVKELAGQTARATGEIATLVQEVRDAAGACSANVASVVGLIRRIEGVAEAIAQAVEEQHGVTQDMARTARTLSGSFEGLHGSIAGLRDAAGTGARAAEQALEVSRTLSQDAGALRSRVHDFAAAARAG
jgi:methyl-accepting chemotaxis protein